MEEGKQWLYLFSETEIFIFVFMEIMVRMAPLRNVLHNQASRRDRIILVVVFGGFSIFGTYIGVRLPNGAISNVRDLAPMLAGLAAGPLAGAGAGLIGGIHRYLLGGFTAVSCSLATVFAGLICGVVYCVRGRRLINFYQGMILAALIECFHGGLTLLIARPFYEALATVKTAIPPMIIANCLGVAIGILIMTDKTH